METKQLKKKMRNEGIQFFVYVLLTLIMYSALFTDLFGQIQYLPERWGTFSMHVIMVLSLYSFIMALISESQWSDARRNFKFLIQN